MWIVGLNQITMTKNSTIHYFPSILSKWVASLCMSTIVQSQGKNKIFTEKSMPLHEDYFWINFSMRIDITWQFLKNITVELSDKYQDCLFFHCVKRVQIRIFFWPVVFSHIRTEYGEIQSRDTERYSQILVGCNLASSLLISLMRVKCHVKNKVNPLMPGGNKKVTHT